MKLRVMKFGGTSVKTKEARMAAAHRVVSTLEQGVMPVVVVSAIGRRGEPYATDTLIGLVRDVDPETEPDARELDLLMSCGEILSSVVFVQTLRSLGQQAISLRGGQAGIRTDGQYGNARILGVNPLGIYEAVNRGLVPVVCGFQGVWIQGGLPGAELTTLGRGGSDTTAACLGAALKADRVEIYTDVDGVKTADPDFVPGAPTLRQVTYDEVAEIAHLGAQVLHPRAAEIGMRFGSPIWVRNTFSEDQGTEVVPRDTCPGRRLTGVTHSGKLVYLHVPLGPVSEPDRRAFAAAIFQALGECKASLYMVNQASDEAGFAVTRDQFPDVLRLLDGLLVPVGGTLYLMNTEDRARSVAGTQGRLLESLGKVVHVPVSSTEGCTMVSIVGHEMMQRPGLYAEVLQVLEDTQTTVLQTTDSQFSLSCLVPESDLRKAVATLHDRFSQADIE